MAVLPSDAALITSSPSGQTSNTATSGAGNQVTPAPNTAANQPVAKAAPAPMPKDALTPPADARYTLLIMELQGPDHVTRAQSLRDQLKETTHDNKWYIVHTTDKSTVYYGFYKDVDRASRDGQAAQRDRDFLAGLKTATGDSPLETIHFVPVATSDPIAPTEWDLAKVGQSPEHYWSLQVASYTEDGRAEHPGDVADRKTAAVESVKALRAQGIPAYYFHGPTISSVCIGIWPESAIKKQSGGDAAGNAASISPNDDIYVTSSLPENVKAIHTKDGKNVKILMPRVDVLDPTLLDTMKKFPYNSQNGYDHEHTYTDPQTHKQSVYRDPSLLVQLPQVAAPTNPNLPLGADNPQLQLAPNLLGSGHSQPEQGEGKLRSVGE